MGSYSVRIEHNGTLTAATVDTVTLRACKTVTVVNQTGASPIYFTLGTVDTPRAAPTVGGDDCYMLPAVIGALTIPVTTPSTSPIVVQVISAGTPGYSVAGSVV